MIKKIIQRHITLGICLLVVFIALASFGTAAIAQTATQYYTSVEESSTEGVQQIVSLESVLKEIEVTHHISFLYDAGLVENEFVAKSNVQNENLVTLLGKYLLQKGLTYKKETDRTYIIMKKEEVRESAVLQELVTGKVTEAGSDNPLPGVNVRVKSTTIGASTDAEGIFELNVPSLSDTLVLSFVGFETKEVPLNGRTTVDVELAPEVLSGDELVVVGYGSSEREDLTGSISSVSSDDMEKTISSSFDQALQGRVAGMTVSRNSGKPGGGVSIQIRGVNSLNGNTEPLYVIDGIPISGSAEATTDASGVASTPTNALATLNPDNIASIEVLKDASATAIYGSRASNGVVLITTKRGKAGDLQLSYDGYYGIQQLPNRVEVMNLREFAHFQNQRAEILGQTPNPHFADPSLLGEGTNWQDALYRDAPMQKHTVTLSGGSEQTQYMFSGNYFDQEGIATASWFKRYSGRLNLDNRPSDWLQVGTSLNLSQTEERINVSSGNIVNLAVRQRPDVPLRAPGGGWGGPDQAQFALDNPVGMANLRENFRNRSQVIGNVYAELSFSDNLKLRNEVDGTFEFANDDQFTPTYQFGERTNEINSAYNSYSNNRYWMIKNYLTYEETVFDRMDVKAMAGHEAQEWYWEGIGASRDNFPNNQVYALSAGDPATDSNSGYAGGNAMESFFGRLNLNYDSRYMITATIRGDGSSKFGPNNRWGYFPSFAVAWRPSEESFFSGIKETDLVNNLKFRFSYGLVGNQDIGNYLYGSTLSAYATPWGSGFLPDNLANPDLKWEETESYNGGLDISLFNERVDLSVDIYRKRTRNLLLSLPLPPHAGTSGEGGFSAPMVNIGSLENEGLEVTLNTINLNQELVWNSDFVFTTNRNEVVKMNNENSVIDRAINFTDVVSRTRVGQPVGQFYGYVVEGIFQNAEELRNSALPPDVPINPTGIWVGDYKYKDINGDGVIDADDRTFIGSPQPDFTFGMRNNLYFRNFDFSFFINGKYGNEIFNDIRRENENPNGDYGLIQSVGNFARIGLKDPNGSPNDVDNVYIENSDTIIPRISSSDANDNYRVSDRFIEDGSYLRLQNVTLGYSLPARLISKLELTELRVYASAENLFTLSGYSGYEPEVGTRNQDALLMGVDDGRYPSARSFTFGINVGL